MQSEAKDKPAPTCCICKHAYIGYISHRASILQPVATAGDGEVHAKFAESPHCCLTNAQPSTTARPQHDSPSAMLPVGTVYQLLHEVNMRARARAHTHTQRERERESCSLDNSLSLAPSLSPSLSPSLRTLSPSFSSWCRTSAASRRSTSAATSATMVASAAFPREGGTWWRAPTA